MTSIFKIFVLAGVLFLSGWEVQAADPAQSLEDLTQQIAIDQAAADAIPEGVVQSLTPDLIAQLKSGGYTVFFRHAHRNMFEGQETRDRAELAGIDGIAICLTETGRAQSLVIGQAFAHLDIPVGKIHTSPLCRAIETAELAFGRVDQIVPGLVFNGPFTEEERDLMKTPTRNLLTTAPLAGENKIIVSHRHILTFLGVPYTATIKQGSAVVFEHTADGSLNAVAHLDAEDFALAIPVSLTPRSPTKTDSP